MGFIGDQPFPPHPYFAFVDIKIGGFDFTPIPPEHLKSFDVTFKSDADEQGVGEGSFVVFDETALRLEYALMGASKDAKGGLAVCYFNFGYSETTHVSHTYSFMIEDYDLTIKSGGAELTVKIVSQALSLHGTPLALAYNTGDSDFMEIHEIIEDIFVNQLGCKKEEIQEIETILVEGDDNNGSFLEKPLEIRLENIPATSATINKILAVCRTVDDKNVNVVLSFSDIDGDIIVRTTSYGYAAKDNEPVKEYSISWDGELGEVISFEVKFDAAAFYTGGGTIDADGFDPDLMDFNFQEHDANTSTSKFLIGGKETHLTPNDATLIPNISSDMREVLAAKSNYLWEKSKEIHYEGNMQILGDPYLKVFDLIFVLVRTPSGLPHHTSGIYIIKEINHSISGGSWKTNLTLFKDHTDATIEHAGTLIDKYRDRITGGGSRGRDDITEGTQDFIDRWSEDEYEHPRGPEFGM